MKNKEHHGIAFRAALQASGESKSSIARALGVSPQSIYHWETRGVPSRFASKVGGYLGIEPSEISAIEKGGARPEPEGIRRTITAPVVDEKGATRTDLMLDSRLFRLDIGIDISVLIKSSSAMAPEIGIGDLVVFTESRAPRPGELCVARNPAGDLIIRRYREIDGEGTIALSATSPDWPEIVVRPESGYQVIGSVLTLIALSKLPSEFRSEALSPT